MKKYYHHHHYHVRNQYRNRHHHHYQSAPTYFDRADASIPAFLLVRIFQGVMSLLFWTIKGLAWMIYFLFTSQTLPAKNND